MRDSSSNEIWNPIWQFIRRDMATRVFEQWVYETPSLEAEFGAELYFRLISINYRDEGAVLGLRRDLEVLARSRTSMPCECIALSDTAVVDMAAPGVAMANLETVADRGDPYWWLHASRCNVCRTAWLVAQEERQNDVFLLHRLASEELAAIVSRNEWPHDFDHYETLLQLGIEAGHRVTFLDPIGDSSVLWTMRDLAADRPGIKLSELAALLNLDIETAAVIARQAVSDGATIDLEKD